MKIFLKINVYVNKDKRQIINDVEIKKNIQIYLSAYYFAKTTYFVYYKK